MAAIMPSLWKLSDKMGLGVHKDTIEEQINAMNKALEQKQENNIANALWNYADASGGGGGGNFAIFAASSEHLSNNYAYGFATPVNGELYLDCGVIGFDGYQTDILHLCITAPVKKISIEYYQGLAYFVPTEDFEGIYYLEGNAKTLTGDTIEADGSVYEAYFNSGPNVAIKKCTNDYFDYTMPSHQ